MAEFSRYAYMRSLNEYLLAKYNSKEAELEFYDYYLFHISSMAISFCREYDKYDYSICNLFAIRSIIEALSILKMYDNNEIGKECKELLRGHQYLCEFKLYNKFKELDKKYFDLEKMKKNFDDVKEYYREMLDINNRELKSRITLNNLPYLNDRYSFYSLIDKYCPNYLEMYKKLSFIVHPHNYYDDYELQVEFNCEVVLDDSFFEAKKYYPNLVVETRHEFRFEEEKYFNYRVLDKISMNSFLLNINDKIFKDLKLEKKGNDNKKQLCFYGLICREIRSIMIDCMLGFSEMAKAKIKPFFELFSVVLYSIINYNLSDCDYKINVIKNYKGYFSKDNIKDINEDDSKNLPKLLGYNGINDFVFKMIDNVFPDNTLNQNSVFKLLYLESQLLSHGNGYMLSSNYGSFSDKDAVNAAINKIVIVLAEKLKKTLDIKAKADKEYRKLSYDLGKMIYEINSEVIMKEKLISIIKNGQIKIG